MADSVRQCSHFSDRMIGNAEIRRACTSSPHCLPFAASFIQCMGIMAFARATHCVLIRLPKDSLKELYAGSNCEAID